VCHHALPLLSIFEGRNRLCFPACRHQLHVTHINRRNM
jgi:hypothetical protein